MTTEADLLEAAAALVFTVEFSWSTVETDNPGKR